MPSAGRPFTPEVITRLVAKGVGVTPIVLHTGVASLGGRRAAVPRAVPRAGGDRPARVNATHARGGRVIAVGTTVVRALESGGRRRRPRRTRSTGWTDLVITPERGVRVVDGLLTGGTSPRRRTC